MLQSILNVLPRVPARALLFRALAPAAFVTSVMLCAGAAIAQNPAPGTAPIPSQSNDQQPADNDQQPAGTAAPGTKPIATRAKVRALNPNKGPRYDNKYEIFGGLSFMNGQAGQNLPKRYNMGGGEVMGTYWLGSGPVGHLGVAADYRYEAGTTPLNPNSYNLNRVLVYQNILSGGVQYRGPRNRYVAIDYHALAGATHGTFDHAITSYPPTPTPPTVGSVGLYSNRTSPWGAVGGSIDFNQGPRFAVRLSPDMIFEHFGTELREYFSIGGGVVYRFGKR